jgi:hypothetical protein
MKKILVLSLALFIVLAAGQAAWAKKAKAKVVSTHKYTGTVVWVDPVQNLVVLKGGEDGDVRFKIHTTTTLKRKGKVVHLSKFVKGDKVTITYRVQKNTKIAAAVY